MKPTKNRVYCNDVGSPKMLFQTEKKANRFIQFNSEEIESENGYSPVRAYFCIFCNGWHVTSKNDRSNAVSKTEQLLNKYIEERKRKLADKTDSEQNNTYDKDYAIELNRILCTNTFYYKEFRYGNRKVE